MAEKSPLLLWEQYLQEDLDDKEKQIIEASFSAATENLQQVMTKLDSTEGISREVTLMRVVIVSSMMLFKRGLGDALLETLASSYKQVMADQRGTTGSA